MAKVLILGAGLTGLSSAYHLEKSNIFDYKIFERDDTPGGLCKSVKHNGFTFDYTGHLLHINNDYFKEFLETVLDLTQLNLITRKSYIYSNDQFTNYPFQTNLYGLPINVITECIEGFINKKSYIHKPKNFYEWVLKHFGAGIGKHFLFTFQSKLFSYDIKKISPNWTGRFVPSTSLKQIIEGALENKTEKIGYNSSFYYPKTGGIQTLTDNITKKLTNKVLTNHEIVSIDLKNKIVYFSNGNAEPYKQLISTLPLNSLLKLIKEPSNKSLGRASDKLLCNSLVNFNLGIDIPNLTNKHWIYFPEKKYAFYRVGFWHNFSQNMVKKDHSSLYGEFSYLPKTKNSKQLNKIKIESISKLTKILGISKQNIVEEKTLILKHAYVLYDEWREKNLEKLQKSLTEESIYSTGRFGAWKYSSMQEAVLDGKDVINTIKKNNFRSATKTNLNNIISQKREREITG